MGKKNQARDSSLPGYRDDPDAVSLHTNPEEDALLQHDHETNSGASSSSRAEQLPSYEASEAIESTSRDNESRANAVAGIEDNYAVIDVGDSSRTRTQFLNKKGTSKEVSARMDERLSDPDELYKYVSDYLQWAPPRPVVWIEGWHYISRRDKDGKSKREKHTDFEIMLSLQSYLGSGTDPEWRRARLAGPTEKVFRGSWRSQRGSGVKSDLEVGTEEQNPTMDLRAWCDAYSADPARLKIFRVTRTVSGIDEQYIKEAVKTAVRATKYCGHLEINIVTEERAVDIYSQHWINRIRNSWMRWIFYLTFLWIFTWPAIFFLTRRWRVFTVDWPFSVPWPERGDGARRYATVSEHEWFEKHQVIMQEMVLKCFKGNATHMRASGSTFSRPQGAAEAPSTGNQSVDGALGFVQAGMRGFNGLRNTLNGRGQDDWGFDE